MFSDPYFSFLTEGALEKQDPLPPRSFELGLLLLRLIAAFMVLTGLDSVSRALPIIYLLFHAGNWCYRLTIPEREDRLDVVGLVADIIFALIVVALGKDVGSPAVLLFFVPLLTIAHFGPSSRWAWVTTGILAAAALAISYSFYVDSNGTAGTPFSGEFLLNLLRVNAAWVIALCLVAVITRFYRVSLRWSQRRNTEIKGKFQRLHEATGCGISILEPNGVIAYTNQQQEKFMPRGGLARQQAGLPCYAVFHEETQPCRWCPLKWKEDYDDKQHPLFWKDGKTEKWKYDPEDLRTQIANGTNWCISNQLEEAKDSSKRLHLFHICFNPVIAQDSGEITHVVESVTEITEAILEMPFLLKKQHDRKQKAAGLPPISVISATDERIVLEMNSAKRDRHPLPDGSIPASKECLLNQRCYEAFGSPDNNYCSNCPVSRVVKTKKPSRGLTRHPGTAMVLAVPLLGPKREEEDVRAVFEYIDDITELLAVEEAATRMNGLITEKDILDTGLATLEKLADADSCVLFEVRVDTVLFRRPDSAGGNIQIFPAAGEIETVTSVCRDNWPGYACLADEYSPMADVMRQWMLKANVAALKHVAAIPVFMEDVLRALIVLQRRDACVSFEEDKERLLYARLMADDFLAALVRASERKQLEDSLLIVNHELSRPLENIYSTLTNIRDFLPNKTESLDEQVRTAIEVTRQSKILCRGLTAALAVEQGACPIPRREQVDVHREIEALVVSLKATHELKDIGFALTVPTGLQLHLNKPAFLFALYAVLDNAIKYADSPSTIDIGYAPDSHSGMNAFMITSCGKPIRSADTESVFRKFWRNENYAQRGDGGLGIGCWAARQYMQLSGGDVRLSANDNVTTFWIIPPGNGKV